MNIAALVKVLQQQITGSGQVTLNDATLGTTGVDALIEQSPLASTQIVLVTQTPPQVQGATILLSGKTAFLSVASMPTAVTITVEASRTDFVLTASPPAWKPSQSFPVLKGTPLDSLALSGPQLIFSTAPHAGDATTIGLQPGLNLSAGLTLAGGYGLAATFFNLPPPTAFVLQGPVFQTPHGPALELKGLLGVKVPVGPLKLEGGFVRARLGYENDGTKWVPVPSLLLGGVLPAQGQGLPPLTLVGTIGSDNNLFLSLIGSEAQPIAKLGDLVGLLGAAAGWQDLLPQPIQAKLNALQLVDVGVGLVLTPKAKQIVAITVDLALKTDWSASLPGSKVLTLDQVTAQWTWEGPTGPGTGTYSIEIAAIGTVAGHAFELDITSDLVLEGTLQKPASFTLASVGSTFFGAPPSGPGEILGVQVEELTFTLDVPAGSMSMGANFSASVSLFGEASLSVQDGGVTFSWSRGDGFSAEVFGTLALGKLSLTVAAELGTETTITGGIAPGSGLTLTGALNSLPGVSISLPPQIPDLMLSALAVSASWPSKAVSLSGEIDAKWTVPVGNVTPQVQVSLAVSSTLNGGTRQYAGTLQGVLDIGSLFSITYAFGNGVTLLRGEWLAQGNNTLPITTVASGLGVNTGTVTPPGGMPDFALQQVGFAADLASGVVVLTAQSSFLQGARAFFIASKASGAWGFAFGLTAPGPWKLSMLPGTLGQDLQSLDFIQFQKTGLVVSTAAIALDKVTAAAGTLFDANQFRFLTGQGAQLAPGLGFVGEIGFGQAGGGRSGYLASIFQNSSLVFQGAFGGSLSTASFQATLMKGNAVTVTDTTNLSMGDIRLVIRPSPLEVSLLGTLKFPVKGQDVLIQGGLAITENAATFAVDAKFPPPELNSPVGFVGVSLLEIGANVSVNFVPLTLDAGLEAKLRIGQTKPTETDFAFEFDLEPDVSPRLLTAKVDKLDLKTMFEALVPKHQLPAGLAGDVVISGFFIYWADQITVLPDGSQATPGFGFNGQIDLFSVFQAQASLKVAATGTDAGIAGDLEMSPVKVPASTGKVLWLTGGSKTGGPKIKLQTKASPYLDIDFSVQLLGAALQLTTQANLTSQGLTFSLLWKTPVVEQRFACTYLGVTNFSAESTGTYGVDTNIPALVLNGVTAIPGFHLKVQATLGTSGKLSGNDFLATLHFALTIGSVALQFALSVTPATLEDFAKQVVKLLADPKQLFNDIIQSADKYLGALHGWADKGIISLEHGLEGVAGTLKQHFSMDAQAAAKAMKDAGFELRALAVAIQKAFNKSIQDVAGILKAIGADVEEVAKVLRAEFDLSSKDAVDILKAVGFSAVEAARALLHKFQKDKSQVVGILKHAGYDVGQLGEALRQSLGATAEEAAQLLKDVGIEARKVALALREAFAVAKEDITNVLKKVGYSAADVAEALRAIFAKADLDVVSSWLLKAGYKVKEAMKAVKKEFNADVEAVAKAFKNAGLSEDELKEALKEAFDLVKDEVEKILKGLGF